MPKIKELAVLDDAAIDAIFDEVQTELEYWERWGRSPSDEIFLEGVLTIANTN